MDIYTHILHFNTFQTRQATGYLPIKRIKQKNKKTKILLWDTSCFFAFPAQHLKGTLYSTGLQFDYR